MSTRLHTLSTCLGVLLLCATGNAVEPAAEGDGEIVEHSYDVYLTVPAPGPEQTLLLDWRNDEGVRVTFGSDATRVHHAGREIGRGPAALPGAVVVRRRMPLIEVISGDTRLVQTWCALPPGGTVAAAPGARIDDLYTQPIAPIAFADEFFYPERDATEWERLSGEWKVGIYRDDLIERDHGDKGPIGASWYEITGGVRAVSATGYDFWDHYRASVAVTADDDTVAGLVFGLRDADSFGVLTLRPGGDGEGLAQVAVNRRGRATTIAERTVPCRAGTWYALSVEVHGSRFECDVAGQRVFSGVLDDLLPGRVGVYADGPGTVKFDDMVVSSTARDADAFDRNDVGACWHPAGGEWSVASGRLKGQGESMARCGRVGAGWSATGVGARVEALRGMGGVYVNWANGSGYALGIEPTRWSLLKYFDGNKEILAREALPVSGPVPLFLQWQDGRLEARVGEHSVVLYDFDAPSGQCGLFAAGSALFAEFSALEPPPATIEIDAVTGRPRYVPGKAEGTRRPAMGYIWRPANGHWPAATLPDRDSASRGLAPNPRGTAPTALWYYQPCPGDAVMTASSCAVPDGTVLGVAIAADGTDVGSGYAAELSASSPIRLRLLRAGEVVRDVQLESGPGDSLTLSRDGMWIAARYGAAGIAFRDDRPLRGDRCGAYAVGEGVTVGGVTLSNRGGLLYSFEGVEPDWQPEIGEWIVHSGMACMDWDYWLTGIGEPRAMAYNINQQPHNLHIDFAVSEYTKGFVNGDHVHYPYHDISLVTCAAGREIDAGYRYLIAGDRGRVTRLLRKGVVVAETADPRFRITMGGHCNSPRAIQVVASQRGGHLTLHINGLKAIEYVDPDPLPGGLVGIGCDGCAANFRDFWMVPVPY